MHLSQNYEPKPVKNWLVALLLSIFLGGFGIDRIYLGQVGLGIAKLLLGAFTFGLWWIIDVILIAVRKVNDSGFYWDDTPEGLAMRNYSR